MPGRSSVALTALAFAMLGSLVDASAAPTADELTAQYFFQQYKVDFNKQYSANEDRVHEAIFKKNLKKILRHNSERSSYRMGVNKFTDMTEHEKSAFKGQKMYSPKESYAMGGEEYREFLANLKPVSDLPAEVDWRKEGVVSPVKNQGGCGSCWAFSATEVLESAAAIATKKEGKLHLPILAPQQLVSCAPNPRDCGGTGGCQGSVQWLGFNYTETTGLSAETSYPYKAQTGHCEKSKIKPVVSNTGYIRLQANNYTVLMNAVATLGPIAISVDAGWMGYESGVYDGHCGSTIDHAVVLVGYGTENGKDYYLVRNSWGEGWGEGGYIKQLRRPDDSTNCAENLHPADGTECKPYPKKQKVCGLCGILSDSSFPTGTKLV